MPQKLSSVTLDVANCFLQMAVSVAKGTVSETDDFKGAVGAVVVKNGDVLGEGQAHIREDDALNANCKAASKAEQRAMMAAMANVDDKDDLKGSTMYLSFVDTEGKAHQLNHEDFFEKPALTSKTAGVVGWVLPYDGNVYMFTRRELLR